MSNHIWPDIDEIAQGVRTGTMTALEQVEKSLMRIGEHEEYDAILTLLKERAIQRAHEVDENIKLGKAAGRLAGVPFIAKDNFLAFGGETTAASNILKGFNAPYQATVIERLEAEGAICVAKANMDAFGHGASTENSDFKVTKNPHDKTRVPGGSSGGPAAAIVLSMAPFAIGTDTGGSNRQPASFTGSVGYKPTYGLLSRSGVIAMASSTDTIGPLTRSVEDAALLVDIMSGKDILDSTTINKNTAGYFPIEDIDLKKVKVGIISEYFSDGLDKHVRQGVEEALQHLRTADARIEEVNLPSLSYALACYYILVPAEISSNLSRYDGQRFGFSDSTATNIDSSYELSRSQGFGSEAKRRIMIGTYVLSSGYYDAYYRKAQCLRTKLIEEFNSAFQKYDFLIGPTAPTTAFKIGENVDDPLKMYLMDIMTVAPSLVGIPAISIPCGVDNSGLPIGLQIMAPQHADRDLLSFASKIERILL